MPTPTPDSQIPGKLNFRFALLPFAGAPAQTARPARRFLSGVQSFHVSGYNKFSLNRGQADLPDRYSLLKWDSELAVSAVKKAEDRDALVLRAFNPSMDETDAGYLDFPAGSTLQHARIEIANFAETPDVDLEGALTLVPVAPQHAVTLLVEPHGE